MEVVSLRASQLTQQLYSSSVRLFASSTTIQQQHQQLIAFCTLVTVALSVLLISLNKHYPHYYPTPNLVVTRCLRCLTYVRRRVSIVPLRPPSAVSLNKKLKRLRTLAYLPSTSTYYNYYTSYLLRPLNKMRKKLRVKNIISIKSGVMASKYGQWRRNAPSNSMPASSNGPQTTSSAPSLYCPACDSAVVDEHFNHHRRRHNDHDESSIDIMPQSQSYPIFSAATTTPTSAAPNRHRNLTEPRINNSKIRLYKKLPLRSMSRAWGEINSIELPTWCRKPCFYFYSWMFNCNLDEIDIDDITKFKNLGEFFRRGLKPDARKIHPSTLVSPCDGKILHFGRVEKGMLEQVKGVNYSLQAFLGERNWPKNNAAKSSSQSLSSSSGASSTPSSPKYTLSSSDDDDDSTYDRQSLNDSGMLGGEATNNDAINRGPTVGGILVGDDSADNELLENSILYNPEENCLYHCVIYLAPGDYHRFHSPTDWTVFARRHFPGELFSVNPSVARWLQGLFNFNERVVYYGEWEHGFFSMTAVGATNVGSIRVYMDDALSTNTKRKDLKRQDLEKSFVKFDPEVGSLTGVEMKKGANFGEFNLGSTIVLIFEAPKDFRFKVNQNEKVFFGCQLGASPFSVEQTKL